MKRLTLTLASLLMAGNVFARTGGTGGTVLYAQDSGTQVVSSTASMTPLTGFTFSRNTLKQGMILKMHVVGVTSVTSTPNLTFAVQLGGTTMLSTGALAVTSSTFWVDVTGVVNAASTSGGIPWIFGPLVSAAGSISWTVHIVYDQTSALNRMFTTVTPVAFDSTVDGQLFCPAFQWSASSASNIVTVNQENELIY